MLTIQDHISETLLITLYMKYLASREANPIIHDEAALALVPQIDYDFAKFNHALGSRVGTALRARYFDQITADFIRSQSHPVVVQLGCGLDDRLGRVGETAASVPFVELDLPEVIELRRQWLPPKPNETLIAASMFDKDWQDCLKNQFPNAQFLFVIEGVLMYFPRELVQSLMARLAQFGGGEMAFDVCSSLAVKNSDRHDSVSKTQARFVYGCDDDREMEHYGSLKLLSAKYYCDFDAFRRVGLLYWAMRLLPFMRRAFRLLHYRIGL